MATDAYGADYYASRRLLAGNAAQAEKVLRKLLRVAEPAPDARVLEIGCGFGAVSRALAARVKSVTALDVSEHAIAQARGTGGPANVEWIAADALAWRPRGAYDLVLALAVFEHFDEAEQKRFLAAASRWLSPEGRLVLHVPITRSWSAARRAKRRRTGGVDYTGDPTHRATFSLGTLRRALREGGFRIDREWVRYARWGLPEGWSLAALRAMPARIREKFAMEAVVAARPE